MPLIQLIVLAIIQGVTEFLPISSSAHLILAPMVVDGWADQGPLIDLAAHLGSLVAVMLYFRKETGLLIAGGVDTLAFNRTANRRLFLQVATATIPVIVFGGVFAVTGLVDMMRSPYVIAATSIVFGVLLWVADRRPATLEGLERVTWREALIIGVAQMFSIVPGTSRSGVTMTAARFLGWTREEAARFSILLAIPTILAGGAYATAKIAADGAGAQMEAAAIVAALSMLTAWATIAIFMRLTKSISFTPFVIYRIIFGVVLLIFAGKLAA